MAGTINSSAEHYNPSSRPDERALSGDDGSVQLTAEVLHDLVGPVNQVRSMVDLLIKRYRGKLEDEGETLCGFIQAGADRLQTLMSGLGTHVRIVGRCQPARDLGANDIVAAATTMSRQAIEDSDAQVTHDDLPEVYCDPTQISFVFASLIENSIKFRSEQRPRIHIAARPQENHRVLFSVRDNGIGIDPRYSERIFGVFKRIHNDAYPGAGVGLPIAKRIVERHGGRISVESQPGQGATFFFTLPKGAGGTAGEAAPMPSEVGHRETTQG
jgi:light-regulated signal transduction histidine kinase (bacteriophytochrome)